MQCTEFVEYIKNRFFPDPVVLSDRIIMQNIEEAFDYWNNHSAYKTQEELEITWTENRSGYAVVSNKIKFMTKVMPNKIESQGQNYHPDYMMLGMITTDRFMSADFIQWKHWMGGWQTYANADFRVRYEPDADPLVNGGKLYVQGMPTYSTKVVVEGALRIFMADDIKDPQIYQWLRKYAYALCLEQQGKAMRKASLIGANSDGDDQVSEGAEMRKDLEQELRESGRWLLLMQRG